MNFKTKSTILTLALSVAVCAMPTLALAAGVDSDPNLTKLENKFFQHDYAKDDVESRLDRLEKLVFGESKTGEPAARLKNLVSAVPNLDAPAETSTAKAPSGGSADDTAAADDGGAPQRSASSSPVAADPDAELAQKEQQIEGGSQYPAVTAMEKKLLGRDYASEPIVKRLERLETKVFGKPVEIADLSDRVDRLKSQTGIDLAKTPPPGSDWADDEDQPMGTGRSDITYIPERRPTGGAPAYNPANDPMFNGRGSSLVQRAPAWSGGSGGGTVGGGGSYGSGKSVTSSGDIGLGAPSGGYGYTAPRRVASLPAPSTSSGIPQTAPDVVRGASVPQAAIGLSQQVALLENELFRKTFANETIPVRLNRLESTVFPGNRPSTDMSLPDRVHRLISAVPISTSAPQQVAQRPAPTAASGYPPVAPDYGQDPQVPQPAPQRGPSGFSKIINGLGNLLTGGGMMGGAYPVGSNLVQDPTTGMLIDRFTGNVIDPVTGVVVRQGTGAPMGGGYSTYGGFNNGLSPIGSPYGMNSGGMQFGFGGSGIRFGGGGMGLGTGMGMGTGIWP